MSRTGKYIEVESRFGVRRWRDGEKGEGVLFVRWDDENVLELIVVIDAQVCKSTKSHWICTLWRVNLWHVNCTSIKKKMCISLGKRMRLEREWSRFPDSVLWSWVDGATTNQDRRFRGMTSPCLDILAWGSGEVSRWWWTIARGSHERESRDKDLKEFSLHFVLRSVEVDTTT